MGLLALLLEIARYRDREAEREGGCWHWYKRMRVRKWSYLHIQCRIIVTKPPSVPERRGLESRGLCYDA